MPVTKVVVLAAVFLSACTLQRWQPAKSSAVDDHMSHMGAADLRAPMTRTSSTSGQGTSGIPAGAADAEARLKASNRHAEWVKIPWESGSTDSLMAWVVYPMTTGKAPVVIVIHEIFGLQTWVRGVADQLAADGFIAIAPDLLSNVRGGPSTTELTGDSARKLISQVNPAIMNRGVTAAAKYGMSLPSAEKKYGVVGYCWGGSAVWNHAVFSGKQLAAGVVYYGSAPPNDSLSKIQAPLLGLLGGTDNRVNTTVVRADSTMKTLSKSFEYRAFDGAQHGFLRAQDVPANLEASKLGWPMTVAFFKKNLGVK